MGMPKTQPASNWANIAPRHRVVARLLLEGLSRNEIAESSGYTTMSITNIKKRPDVQELVETLQDKADGMAIEVGARIRQLVPAALDIYEKIVSTPAYDDPKMMALQKQTADAILDRGGLPKQRDINVSSNNTVSSEDIESARRLVLDAARKAGLLVSAEAIDSQTPADSPSASSAPECLPSTPQKTQELQEAEQCSDEVLLRDATQGDLFDIQEN